MRPTRIPAAAAVWAALLTWLPVSGAQDGTTAAGAASSSSSECARPAQRREWRTLSRDDQAAYVAAVKCLATKPSSMGLPTSLYEDFTWVHWHLNDDIHFVAQFLPWHRWFVHQYEQALRDACAYAGHMVYWDWTQDSGALPSAPVFSADPATGFGTDVPPGPGRSSASLTWCLQDGAFADLQLTYFDGRRREHCLNRRLNNGTNRWPDEKRWRASRYSAAAVERLTDEGTWFSEFAPALERRPHAAIHDTLGGDMGPMRTSPNDPLFFLHHAQVDRLWWRWQQRRRRPGTDGDDARARDRDDYEGRRYPDDARQPASAALDDPMPMMRLNGADDVPVRDVMSTRQGPLCYEYV